MFNAVMDKLDQYRVFMQVAEMGSFVKAANALNLPRATVSLAIQQLEEKLGARLLSRTTRQVHLTTDGAQLLERLHPLLADVEEVDQLFQSQQHQVAGPLHVDAPSRIARRLIAPALPGLLQRYPRLQLVLSSTDRTIDLVQEGVDCAVRVGVLSDSSLAARPLGQIALINCASPGYLQAHGVPQGPADLAQGHWAVGYAAPSTGRESPWTYRSAGGETRSCDLPSRVVVDNAENYIACCRAGLGLIQIPRFDVRPLLDSGELVEVMPEHRPDPLPMSLIYPHRRQRTRRLAVFIDWFEGLLAAHLES